jgi:hypothetical protein
MYTYDISVFKDPHEEIFDPLQSTFGQKNFHFEVRMILPSIVSLYV